MRANCIGLQKELKLNNYYIQMERLDNILRRRNILDSCNGLCAIRSYINPLA